MVVPQNTPKWSFLVGKPMVVGYRHFRKPQYKNYKISGSFPPWKLQVFHLDWIRDVGGVTATAPSIDTGSPENVAAKVSEGSVEVLESWLHVSPVFFWRLT